MSYVDRVVKDTWTAFRDYVDTHFIALNNERVT